MNRLRVLGWQSLLDHPEIYEPKAAIEELEADLGDV